MLLIKLAYFTLIFLQLNKKTSAFLPDHSDVFMKYPNEELKTTYNSGKYSLRFLQKFLDRMYARANSIPQDEALRMLKLIMKKMAKYTAPSQEEYWLLRQG